MIAKQYAAWLACIAIYGQTSQFDQVIGIGPDRIGLKQVGDILTITPEGSVDAEMWENNFEALPAYHPILGNMHQGFLESAQAIYKAIKPFLIGPISFQGHSRGAALANILASLCALDGIKVSQLFLFECPNVGYQRYEEFCASQFVNGNIGFELSTINDLDPVPYIPLSPYVASWPQTELNHAPGGLVENLDLIDWHLGATIYAGMQKMFPQEQSCKA